MSDPARPNILILYADQHHARAVGYEDPQVKTPHLDRLASQGVVFSNSFCQYPVCTPSRTSLLTGQYVHTHGVWQNSAGCSPDAPMFPRLLRDAAYATAAFGKMHFHPTYADYGFDRMELAEQNGPGRFEDDYHRDLASKGVVDLVDLIDQESFFRDHASSGYWETFGAHSSDLPEELHSTTWIGDRAARWLESAEPPFCAWVGFIKPHHPFDPPASWLHLYDEDSLRPFPGWTEAIPEPDASKQGYFDNSKLTAPALRRVMAHYFAAISHVDAQIGRILSVLERRGLDNTLVIYTADHGELLGYHHLLLKGSFLYDPLIRVPLVIARMGHLAWPQGLRSDALVESLDVTSTLLDVAGVEQPPAMQGRTLGPVLRGESTQHRDCVFAQINAFGMLMLRDREWKLFRGSRADDDRLYNLARDPAELMNLYGAAETREIRADLERRLLRHLCATCRPMPYESAQRTVCRESLDQFVQTFESSQQSQPTFRGINRPYLDLCRSELTRLARDEAHPAG